MSKIYFFRHAQASLGSDNYDIESVKTLIIDKKSLPSCLSITAETKNKTIMGIKHNIYEKMEYSFILKALIQKLGQQLIKNFIDLY